MGNDGEHTINAIVQLLIFEFSAIKEHFKEEGEIRVNTNVWHDAFDCYPLGTGHASYALHYHELLYLASCHFHSYIWGLRNDDNGGVWLTYKLNPAYQE